MKVKRAARLAGLLVSGISASFPFSAMAQAGPEDANADETIVVTGSLLPHGKRDTATPVIVVTQDDMRRRGFSEVFDALRGQAIVTGAMRDGVPGSGNMQGVKMINLFGLGPSYTKVLVNGRPMANYPLNNNSGDGGNFANLSTVPSAMVDRIEILPGTQSAIYGADAVAGVVNIILRNDIDTTTVSLRGSGYSEGGGEGIRAQLVGGTTLPTAGTLGYAFEYNRRTAILGIDRDKTAYSPYEDDAFARISGSSYYDPGEAGCAQMSDLFGGTMTYRVAGAMRYCGTDHTRSALATYDAERRNLGGYVSISQPLADNHGLYLDLSGMSSRTVSNWGPVYVWENFKDTATSLTYLVSREIAPEEMGSWKTSAKYDDGLQYDVALGGRGLLFGDSWRYDLYASRSYSRLRQNSLLPVAADMTAYLTKRYGDISQVFVPLTPEEYAGFSGTRRRDAFNRIQQIVGKVYNGSLVDLPGGSAGIAVQAEVGSEKWEDTPDTGYQSGIYFDGSQLASGGSRNHSGIAGELVLPVFSWLGGSVATRYDDYGYAGKTTDRMTWKAGLEFRPVPTLLIRGGAGTAFRAPDMSYLFLGQSVGNSNNYDLYRCDQLGVSRTSNSCRYIMRNESVGNLDLRPVTAGSMSAGAVWTPADRLRLSVDYIDVDIRNEIRALTVPNILFDEAACRQGGNVTYLTSCDYALSLVSRDATTGNITNITRGYFNVSEKETQSLMIAGQYALPIASLGTVRFDLNYNRTLGFKSQADAVSPVVDQLKSPSAYGMFKDSLNSSLTLETGNFSATVFATRYGESPNYALLSGGWNSTAYGTPGWDKPWTLVNISARYTFASGLSVNAVVNNVANRMPPSKDWDGFPGYNSALYNVYGRSFSLEVTKSF